jgi:rubrerythrin
MTPTPAGRDRAALDAIVAREALASVRALAAAERAVDEGRLNIAKVLRAAALSARQRALALERVAASSDEAIYALATIADGNAETMQALTSAQDEGERTALAGAKALDAIFDTAIQSLQEHRDVPESAVAQFLMVCEECGLTVEAPRPEVCPACGSFGGEFALFAPFFSATQEHIARRTPDEIVDMLRGDHDAMRAALDGMSDEAMRSRPGEGEWCIKEIAGHMIDIVEMAARRLAPIADPAADDAAEPQLLPWKIIDGQDYPSKTADELIDRYGRGLDDLLRIIVRLEAGDWRKKTMMSGSRVAAIDVGSWVANHNVAHLQQILALRDGA